MTTRQILDTWFDKYLRDAVPSERVDELVRELDTLFRDTAKGCVPENMNPLSVEEATDNPEKLYLNIGHMKAVDHFNQNIEKRFSSYSDFAHNATDEEKKQVITKAINEANEEQRKEVK